MPFEKPDDSLFVLIICFTTGVIAVIGNGIILLITILFKKFRLSICNCLIGLLAFSEFLEGISILLTISYAFYKEINHITNYSREYCLGFALPGIFGIIAGQITMLSMAYDRFLAIRKPLAYHHEKSRSRLYLPICISLFFGLIYAAFATYNPDKRPIKSCSIGGTVTLTFITAYAIFSVIMAISILAVYSLAVITLSRNSSNSDRNFAIALQRQRKVFVSISLILLSYALFWCFPLFVGIVMLITNPNPVILGYMSMAIGLGSGLNSCVGIFIYLAKHHEVKEYFIQLFPCFKHVIKTGELSMAVVKQRRIRKP